MRLADNVGSEYRRQCALLTGHGNFPRSIQRIVVGVRPVGNRVGANLRALVSLLASRSFAALAGHYQAMFWYRVVDSGFRPGPVMRSNESRPNR